MAVEFIFLFYVTNSRNFHFVQYSNNFVLSLANGLANIRNFEQVVV